MARVPTDEEFDEDDLGDEEEFDEDDLGDEEEFDEDIDNKSKSSPKSELEILKKKLAEVNKEKFTLARQLEAVKAKESARGSVVLKGIKDLSVNDKEYLDTLKDEDPEQWRVELNNLEKRFKEEYEAKVTDLEKKAKLASVRKYIIKGIQEEYPKINLTEALLEARLEELPHRLVVQLGNPDLDYASYISEVGKFLSASKTTSRREKTMKDPNLSKTRGAVDKPTKSKSKNSLREAVF